jgi:hypothetical protein
MNLFLYSKLTRCVQKINKITFSVVSADNLIELVCILTFLVIEILPLELCRMSDGFHPNIYVTNRELAIFYRADCVVLHQSIQIYLVLQSSPHFVLKELEHASPVHPFPTLSRHFHVCFVDSSFFDIQRLFLSRKVLLPSLLDESQNL